MAMKSMMMMNIKSGKVLVGQKGALTKHLLLHLSDSGKFCFYKCLNASQLENFQPLTLQKLTIRGEKGSVVAIF